MKIISGGDVGVEATAIRFAVSHNIDTEINTYKNGEVLNDQRGLYNVTININKKWRDINGGRLKTLEYNVKHSDITIFISDIGSFFIKERMTVHNLCERLRKDFLQIDIVPQIRACYWRHDFPRCSGGICVGGVVTPQIINIQEIKILLNNHHPGILSNWHHGIINITGQKDINKDGLNKLLEELVL